MSAYRWEGDKIADNWVCALEGRHQRIGFITLQRSFVRACEIESRRSRSAEMCCRHILISGVMTHQATAFFRIMTGRRQTPRTGNSKAANCEIRHCLYNLALTLLSIFFASSRTSSVIAPAFFTSLTRPTPVPAYVVKRPLEPQPSSPLSKAC